MIFGIAKSQLTWRKVKLARGCIRRDGRSPNPDITRPVEKWPPVNTLKGSKGCSGLANSVRARVGPSRAKVTSPLRAPVKPKAHFPPKEEQLKAIEAVKNLLMEGTTLAVPDEAAAIRAAIAWLADEPPKEPQRLVRDSETPTQKERRAQKDRPTPAMMKVQRARASSHRRSSALAA